MLRLKCEAQCFRFKIGKADSFLVNPTLLVVCNLMIDKGQDILQGQED